MPDRPFPIDLCNLECADLSGAPRQNRIVFAGVPAKTGEIEVTGQDGVVDFLADFPVLEIEFFIPIVFWVLKSGDRSFVQGGQPVSLDNRTSTHRKSRPSNFSNPTWLRAASSCLLPSLPMAAFSFRLRSPFCVNPIACRRCPVHCISRCRERRRGRHRIPEDRASSGS